MTTNGWKKIAALLAALTALGILGCRCSIPRLGDFEFRLLPTRIHFGQPTCGTNQPAPSP